MILIVLDTYNDAFVGEPVEDLSINNRGHLVTKLFNGRVRESTKVQTIKVDWVDSALDPSLHHNQVTVTTRTSVYAFRVLRDTVGSAVEVAFRLCDELIEQLGDAGEDLEPEEWWA